MSIGTKMQEMIEMVVRRRFNNVDDIKEVYSNKDRGR